MRNGIFKCTSSVAFARATEIMFTQSTSTFEWSVKLIETSAFGFRVGIASQFQRNDNMIFDYDDNAIFYYNVCNTHVPIIKVGKYTIHSNLTKHKSGDVIKFRFQPDAKKLFIEIVRLHIELTYDLTYTFRMEILKLIYETISITLLSFSLVKLILKLN